jgi:hypothetical protein
MPSVTIDTNIDINASREAVWKVLIDFPNYSEWSPSVRIEGTPEVGRRLVVHMSADGVHGMSFKPEVLAITPNRELRWIGKLGIHGIADGEHYFILNSNDDGTTRLNHGERFSGALIALAKGNAGKGEVGYEAFSLALKQRVEQLGQG